MQSILGTYLQALILRNIIRLSVHVLFHSSLLRSQVISLYFQCLRPGATRLYYNTNTHVQVSLSHWEPPTVTLWPAAETGCLGAAVPAPDSAVSFKRKKVMLVIFTLIRQPAVQPAEPGSRKAHDCIHLTPRSNKPGLLFQLKMKVSYQSLCCT